ncbi:MAG: putative porin, partial [Bacteroidales bacterium]
EQYFNLLKPLSKKGNQIRKIDVGHISYSFLYEQNKLIYQDADTLSNFYIGHLAPLDSTSTLDSIYQRKISNTFKWSSIGYQDTPDEKHFYLFFGITQNHLIQSYAYDSVNNTYNQLIPFAGMGINIGKSFYLNVDAQLAMGDYNGGDYRLSGKLNQYLGRKDKNVGEFSASLDLMSKTPEWYFNTYNSNLYRWNNTLKKEQYSILSGSYSYREITVGGTLNSIVNYTYFNDSMQPSQIEKGESILQLYIEGSLPWKSVGLNTRIVYQETSQPNQIRLPKLTGTMDLYFQHTIFKQAATVKTGFQVTYFTSYYADAYMPELRVFYLQNEQKIGNYPYIDFYLTLVVKRARMFFKWAHLNGYLNDNRYYAAPHYPSRDARLYFGVSWRFHD